MTWLARPDVTGSRDIVVGEVEFTPDGFHHFHYHPRPGGGALRPRRSR
ncbi:MAG: hypothetical protein ABI927_09265 [Gaiellaceae bacterium]